MNDQIFITLKRKLEDLAAHGEVDVETQRNVLKEELQYYVLNFICHHPKYNNWIMYGGSTLRICHEINRMSVDLDFEIKEKCTDAFLSTLKKAILQHFATTHRTESDFLTIKITHGRGLLLRFHIGDKLGISHPSKQVHIKIDLNHFAAAKIVTERIPINHDQFSFVITTYNMSALMASKIAAIFLRGKRGVGKALYEEKGRDIYDLLWYMEKKIIPDFDYLAAKGIDMTNPRALFDQLTLQMNKVKDENLRQDLTPLFINQRYIANWLEHWRESYLRLVEAYQIRTVTDLREVVVHQDFDTDNFSFIYFYNTEEGKTVRIAYIISDYWIEFLEGDLPTKINDVVVRLISGDMKKQLNDKLKQYATLFYEKSEAYFKKTNRVMLGNSIITKTIRMTADKLNQKEQIVLNKSTLLSCEFEDLLR